MITMLNQSVFKVLRRKEAELISFEENPLDLRLIETIYRPVKVLKSGLEYQSVLISWLKH